MKAIKLADWQQKNKKEEQWCVFKPCCVCNKPILEGFYARYGDGGVCSKTCMVAQDKLPKYPDHPERSDDDTTDST